MDPTQVDARYQIQFLPPGGGMIIDDFPVSTGPYTVPILLINNDGGLRVDDFQALDTIRASLTQQGVIGTLGGQSLAGPFYLVPENFNQAPPMFSLPLWSLVLQDGALAFYSTPEGAISQPKAEIDYDTGGGTPFLHMECDGWLEILGGRAGFCRLSIQNLNSGSFYEMGEIDGTSIFDPGTILLEVPGNALLLGGQGPASPASLDLADAGHPHPYFSLQSDTFQGQWGTDSIGNEFSGGLCTTVAGGATIPWSSITGTPTTFVGYGLATPILPGDPAGGDLTGTYPNPGVGQIQGFPLAISGPISGDVLTWGGLSWVAAPGGGGGGLAIGNPVGGGAGNRVLLEDPAANLADSPQVVWDATNGMLVNDGATCSSRLAQFGVAASFTDSINSVRMCDGTWAMQVTFGAIKLAGGTVDFPNSHVAPTTTQAVPAPASAYGQGTIVNYLGDPDVWVQVTLAGTQYCLPLYLP